MAHRLYKLINQTELAQIGARLAAASEVWSAAWLAGAAAARVQCHRAAEWRAGPGSPAETWMARGADPAQWLALRFGTGFNSQLGRKLIPGAAAAVPSALLDELLMLALADLLHPHCPWLAGSVPEKVAPAEGVPAQAWETGSGAVVAELAWGEARLIIVFSAAQVRSMQGGAAALPAARAPFAMTTDGLLGERVQLKVWAGAAQLELGLLQTIVVGDVIKLDTRIDEPLEVQTSDGAPVCHAFLGSFQGRKSIKLIA